MNKIREFRDFIDRKRPQSFIFLSENQDAYRVADPCKLSLTFSNMLINTDPNVICLTANGNTMCLDMVKDVEYSEGLTPLGTLIRVRCGGDGNGEYCYSLIAV